MTLAAWVSGTLLLAALVVPAVLAARDLRRSYFRGWDGSLARLVEAVTTAAIVIGTSQVLGAVGLFRRLLLPLAVLAVSAGVALLCRRRAGPAEPVPGEGTACRFERVHIYAAIAAVAVVAGQWASFTAKGMRSGIVNADSIWYHLPRAARFAETGWVTRLHHTAPEFPDAFHPSSSELVHAIPMLAYGRDAVAPLLNLGWMALVLLAAWCIGRRHGRAALTMLGACALLASPLLVIEGAGNAGNDLAAIFFLLASVALLLESRGQHAAISLAGVAAGLSMSTKLTVVPAVVVLSIGLVWAAPRAARLRRGIAWAAPLVAFGSYWYVRNLVTVGSPVPSTNLPLLGERHFRIADELGFSVADYLTDLDVWRSWFLPGLRHDFGWAWPIVMVGFVTATIGALGTSTDRLVRVMGAVLPVSLVAYLVLPTTALGQPGEPILFAANVVYVMPAVMIAVVILPTLPMARSSGAGWVLLGCYVATLVVSASTSPLSTIADGLAEVGLAAAAVVLAAGLLLILRPPSNRTLVVVAGAAAAAAVTAGFFASDHYLDHRYDSEPAYRWANDLAGAHIAIAGFGGQFPYYGSQLDNAVQYVGDVESNGEFHDIERCSDWREALRDGGYDYVVLRSERTDVTDRQLAWTVSDPAARLLHEADGAHVFSFAPDVADPGCPSDERA